MFSNNLFVGQARSSINEPLLSNRKIPEPIKRAVRQRCGFGCVICGGIIYDYDHMINDWSEVKEHIENDITLLCPTHHREKTNGMLTRDKVKDANDDPYNKKNTASTPYQLNLEGDIAIAVIASNIFTNATAPEAFVNILNPFSMLNPSGPMLNAQASQGKHHPFIIPILIDDFPVIQFKTQDERLWLNITLFDEFNEAILCVIDNQLIFKPETWDIEFKGKTLKVREGSHRIILELEFFPPNKVIIVQAKIRLNGVTLDLKKDHFVLNGERSHTLQNNAFSSPVGISIGKTDRFPHGLIHEARVNRY